MKKVILTTLHAITLAMLLFSADALAMKKADFIKNLNNQIAALEVQRDQLLNQQSTSNDPLIMQLNAEIAALQAQKEQADL